MMVRHKLTPTRYSPYPSPKPMKRETSMGRLAAHGSADDGSTASKPDMPRVQSAPARLGSLNNLAKAAQGDLVDAAYFAPPTPSRQLGDDSAVSAVGPSALTLRAPHTGDGPKVHADVDRGGVTFSEETNSPASDVAFSGTRNLGGSSITGSVEHCVDGIGHHGKLGMTAVTNGQTVALAPSVAIHDVAKSELGLGIALFGAAHSGVSVLPGTSDKAVPIESRHALSRGFSIDPRLTWAPAWAGIFFKMVQSRADESLFRLSVTRRRAGKLLTRQNPEGVTAPLQNWFRQWARVASNQPAVRQPNINDPFADDGGRTMRPGQTKVQYSSQTRVIGAGAGAMGLRMGRYKLTNEDRQITVRCLDDRHVALAISPRASEASSTNVDSPLGPNLQGVDTWVKGTLSERIFNLRDPAQKEIYQRLVRGGPTSEDDVTAAPAPHVTENATLVRRDESKGATRLPFETTWGGFGEHLSRQTVDVSREEEGHLSQSREVVGHTIQHALEQGKNAWRIGATSRASSVGGAQPASMLAFRGLHGSTERSATRPDLAMRNIMTDEHARLWRVSLPTVTDGPRNDYSIVASVVFSGRQLHALENAIPQRAAAIAQACGAAPEALIALIGALRNASSEVPLKDPLARAWRRSTLVSDYLSDAGAVGLAALHRLVGGWVDVRTESTAYHAPLQALEELKLLEQPSRAKAQKIVDQLHGSLRAAHADAILRSYNGAMWLDLIAKLERGLSEATKFAAS